MSKEKSEKDVRNVPITVRLNEEEHKKINDPAASCGVLREVAPLHIVEYAILLCLRFFFI